MTRRASRRPAAAHPSPGPLPCPCGLPAVYDACCGRLHRGETAAATAERLMRSRYSAFAVGDEPYLLRSWHPRTRPAAAPADPELRWLRLEILATDGGSPFHSEGRVSFRAHHIRRGRAGVLEEESRFVRDAGAWVYLDGAVSGESG
ncbi:YchJ family protein [Streptomyces zingiberis]|uniref:UPF0225 protein HCK00_14385 n=1 Tax=Streptomyces zingiberis TaxID=2053010 RepID=A0ABX1BZD6_9ACTN|nr:YchJ family metal-binding protein [Streptomyces zingiberis]NJQ01683.1 hypothetical protein [Streptomyces zingiberis]